MQTITLENDYQLFFVNVPDFPLGIKEKFIELQQMLPNMQHRTFYGLSYMNDEDIVIYNCAVTELEKGEAAKYGGTPFTLEKGEYLAEPIHDWMDKLDTIGLTLEKLMDNPTADKSFPCVEWYKTETELMCMVKKA